CTKINQDNKNVNEFLTAELERYKDHVKFLKEHNNVDIASESYAQSLEIDNLKHILSEHLKENERLLEQSISTYIMNILVHANVNYASLKETLSKLKGKVIVNEDVTLHPIDPELLKRIFRYLRGTVHRGLWYSKDSSVALTAFADADHASAKILVAVHLVENGVIKLYFINTEYQLTDLFTKALSRDRIEFIINKLGMRSFTPETLKQLTDEVDETMDTTIDQQVAIDEALVPHAKRLRIRMSNFCLLSDIKSKESTLQLVYDVLRLSPFFKAFLVTADVEHKDTKKSNEMYYPCFTKVIIHHFMSKDPSIPRRNNVNWHYVRDDHMFSMIKLVEHKDTKKSNEMYYPCFTKVIIHHFMSKDPSIPRRNNVNWHYVRDDHMFSMIKLVSRHQNTQQFGALLPIELTNEDIRNSNAYKEYYAVDT
nr:retrovirus-related Pol polyprotein from transposon TNT 1-94 [Tanacetum cinerariifolium]